MMNVSFVGRSKNTKVGPIPVTTSPRRTCPDACPLKAKGCYAEAGNYTRLHWDRVDSGTAGIAWDEFLGKVAALPVGSLWRHNVAGDLPGDGDAIDTRALADLATANEGKRGWTYTHKPMTTTNLGAVAAANLHGFTVNASADTLAEADELADLMLPVVIVLDAAEGVRHDLTTPAGRKVATCPATYRDDVTCASCGLCQRQDRKVIVGFPAHGNAKKAAATIARG